LEAVQICVEIVYSALPCCSKRFYVASGPFLHNMEFKHNIIIISYRYSSSIITARPRRTNQSRNLFHDRMTLQSSQRFDGARSNDFSSTDHGPIIMANPTTCSQSGIRTANPNALIWQPIFQYCDLHEGQTIKIHQTRKKVKK
jgi:hypothetical protein